MLGRIKKTRRKQRRGAMSTVDRQSGDSTVTTIAPGMTITGDCETEGTVRIEGRIEGKIRAGKSVVVGRVSGSITAASRVELRADCDIEGEIRSPRVQMDEGARFNGQLYMEDPAKASGESEGDRETKKRKNQQQRKRPSGQDQRGEHEVSHLSVTPSSKKLARASPVLKEMRGCAKNATTPNLLSTQTPGISSS